MKLILNYIIPLAFISLLINSENIAEQKFYTSYENIIEIFFSDEFNFIETNVLLKDYLSSINDVFVISEKDKNNNISMKLFYNSKDVAYDLNNNAYHTMKSFRLKSDKEFNQFLMFFALHSFLIGDIMLEIDYSNFNTKDQFIYRKTEMINHFIDKYDYSSIDGVIPIHISEAKILYEDEKAAFWLKEFDKEFLLMCLNNADSNIQIILEDSFGDATMAFSLLDRSLIAIDKGKALINLSAYETKLYTIKKK